MTNSTQKSDEEILATKGFDKILKMMRRIFPADPANPDATAEKMAIDMYRVMENFQQGSGMKGKKSN